MEIFRKVFLMIVLLFISYMDINAEEKRVHSNDRVAYLHQEPIKSRPRSPSRVFLRCYYGKGFLSIEFKEEMTFIEIEISKDDNVHWEGMVYVQEPEILIPELYGEYEITCRTDGNQIFKGKLQFN